MHLACDKFWEFVSKRFPSYFSGDILEFGSYNINGTIRDHFKNGCKNYVGIDWRDGPCVDIVGLAHKVKFNYKVDAVFSASMLEHDPYWEKSLENMINHLNPGGILVLSWGSAKNAVHCLPEAPDGKFHSLKVQKIIDFLEDKKFFIQTSVYDGDLVEMLNDYTITFEPQAKGYGEHNLIAFNVGYDETIKRGFMSDLLDEDK